MLPFYLDAFFTHPDPLCHTLILTQDKHAAAVHFLLHAWLWPQSWPAYESTGKHFVWAQVGNAGMYVFPALCRKLQPRVPQGASKGKTRAHGRCYSTRLPWCPLRTARGYSRRRWRKAGEGCRVFERFLLVNQTKVFKAGVESDQGIRKEVCTVSGVGRRSSLDVWAQDGTTCTFCSSCPMYVWTLVLWADMHPYSNCVALWNKLSSQGCPCHDIIIYPSCPLFLAGCGELLLPLSALYPFMLALVGSPVPVLYAHVHDHSTHTRFRAMLRNRDCSSPFRPSPSHPWPMP